jgi:hypothetical protein
MTTTLEIADDLMARLREEAARRNVPVSELVEAALRLFLDGRREEAGPPPLPTFRGGRPLVDISDREALDDFLDEG